MSDPGATPAPVVRLALPARPEGVGVVRQALAGLADAMALDGAILADAKMAVTEACTNVVVHAYGEVDGALEVEMLADDHAVTVVVRDQGTGIRPRAQRHEQTALGLGLPLIAALSDAFEVRGGPGIGTEVRMTFHYEREIDPADERPITGGPGADGRWDLDAEPDISPS
jgi:anti-sigma regulatory factor (Ser/Thr protein kinase)